MNEEDYLKVLGLDGSATWEDIKKAFFKIAVKTHPDKGGNEEDFKKANSAYQYFRSKYEKTGRTSTHTKNDDNFEKSEVERNVIFDKIITALGLVLGRINFFALIAVIFGVIAALFGGLLTTDPKDETASIGVAVLIVGILLLSAGIFLYSEKKKILKHLNDFSYIKKHLARMSAVAIVLAILISPVLLYGAPIIGLFAVVYFFSIILNTTKAYYYLNRYMNFNGKKDIKKQSKNFFTFIYPKINHDIWWHRLVSVVGWVVSICSLWFIVIVFPIYFGLIQRVIYFIAYGENKSKWMK